MLLVDDDHAEPGERREHRRARADRDPRVAAAQPRPLAQPRGLRQPGVQDRDEVAEPRAKPRGELRRQRDLGHQHQRGAPGGERGRDHPQVDLGLAAAGHAVQEERRERPALGLRVGTRPIAGGRRPAERGEDLVDRTRLLVGERGRRGHRQRGAARRRGDRRLALGHRREPELDQLAHRLPRSHQLARERGDRDRLAAREPLDHREPPRGPRHRRARGAGIDRELHDPLAPQAGPGGRPLLDVLDHALRAQLVELALDGRGEPAGRQTTRPERSDPREQRPLPGLHRSALAVQRGATGGGQRDDPARRDPAAGRQRRPDHLARRRLVIVGDPRAQLDQLGRQRRLVVEHLRQRDRHDAGGRRRIAAHHHAGDLAPAEADQHARADHRPRRERWRDRIVKPPRDRQGHGHLGEPRRGTPRLGWRCRPRRQRAVRPRDGDVRHPRPQRAVRPRHGHVRHPRPPRAVRPRHGHVRHPRLQRAVRPRHGHVRHPRPQRAVRPRHGLVRHPRPQRAVRREVRSWLAALIFHGHMVHPGADVQPRQRPPIGDRPRTLPLNSNRLRPGSPAARARRKAGRRGPDRSWRDRGMSTRLAVGDRERMGSGRGPRRTGGSSAGAVPTPIRVAAHGDSRVRALPSAMPYTP